MADMTSCAVSLALQGTVASASLRQACQQRAAGSQLNGSTSLRRRSPAVGHRQRGLVAKPAVVAYVDAAVALLQTVGCQLRPPVLVVATTTPSLVPA
jgi:hypothetical protein